jgi:hypothetical protein
MAVCWRDVNDPSVRAKVLREYLEAEDKPTIEVVATRTGITYQTISRIVRDFVPADRQRLEKILRYSKSKMGDKNPMLGKTGESHHNWKGECSDQKGYLTQIVDGERYFVHRIVMAEMLNIHVKDLPPKLDVHHIDSNPLNNSPDNLCLLNPAAHAELHAKRSKFQRSPIWEQWQSMTSK